MFWQCGHVACVPVELSSAQLVLKRHQLKGVCEQRFSKVLSGLDLDDLRVRGLLPSTPFMRSRCWPKNFLLGLKLPEMPDEDQGLGIRSIIRHLLALPVTISRYARSVTATICIVAGVDERVAVVFGAVGAPAQTRTPGSGRGRAKISGRLTPNPPYQSSHRARPGSSERAGWRAFGGRRPGGGRPGLVRHSLDGYFVPAVLGWRGDYQTTRQSERRPSRRRNSRARSLRDSR